MKKELSTLWNKLTSDITEIPEILKTSYFPGLDGLRAVSIILVVISHVYYTSELAKYIRGDLGVEVFFVISGFLITTLLLKEKVKFGEVSLKQFYIRRALRIFPVAYLYLFCLVILTIIFNLNTTLKMFLSAAVYIVNIPLVYGRNWQTGHFWSLSVEEQFYLLFPFFLIRNPGRFLIFIAAFLLVLPLIVLVGVLPLDFYNNHPLIHKFIRLFEFLFATGTSCILIGAAISILLFKKMIVLKWPSAYFLSFFIFIVAMVIGYLDFLNDYIKQYLFALLIGYTIILNLKKDNFFSIILNHPLMIKLGVLSYSIYIWQQLFTREQPWRGHFKYSDNILLNLLVLFIVAYCSYNFYERKFLKLKRKYSTV
ncbi:acyltransferase family protein [Mucilaginibacter sp. X4EP1]|uniref:acyltransferase family protein n=1 Tax=Mucilaginibacter sp. X4EP1 TaxID=2723092 RepID=UPI002167A7EB|nr:acyltransferase [Mucilaginibacter sp. X4EP1]MCS3816177.1 peptidoglycan/LPS O-acetylase OafA/YrhL [Mucilaginibacter sp. X4EP1]